MFKRLLSTFIDQHFIPSDVLISLSPAFPHFLENFSWLLQSHPPCFPVNADQIQIIKDPNIFYETLIEKCASAKSRVIMASLYLGNGNLEKALVKTIHKNLTNNNKLKVNFLLDFTRGTRGEENSKTILLPLLKEFRYNFFLSMYHTPFLRGITKKLAPSRWNELVGLQHMKIYLFDNSVIISGANLSNDYFTNRQDRYILINDKNLADFYANLVGQVQEFSLQINENSEIALHENWKLMPYEGEVNDFINEAQHRISKYFDDVMSQQKHEIEYKPDADTWIFPLIEMGQLGIHHDSLVTKKLFSTCIKGSQMKLATGYFNLTQEYMDTIINKCLSHCSILMAHPNANGFQGARGPAGGIPAAYSLLAKKFYESLVYAKQNHRVNFFEYQKDGWSFHAKGLWYYLPDSKYPNLTLVGSSNFGERSVNRDLETQICLVTNNEKLQQQLQIEVDNLYSLGSTAENNLTNRPIPKWVQAVVSLFRNYF